jgi:hypothetical protein
MQKRVGVRMPRFKGLVIGPAVLINYAFGQNARDFG